MSVLAQKIDFVAFLSVKNANPNGDPLAENMPRTDRRGYGWMESVCLKRKIRNRMQDLGHEIYCKADDRIDDGYHSIEARVKGVLGTPGKDIDAYRARACEAFLDARAFGAVLAWSGKKDGKSGDSIGIRGPVTISNAISVDPVVINTAQITKATNGTDQDSKSSDTMGLRHTVEFGLYRLEGSINTVPAAKTGLSIDDVEVLKNALSTLFVNDESAARPSGSMAIVKIFWFTHDSAGGDCPSAQVFRNVHAEKKPGVTEPFDVSDYDIYNDNATVFPNLSCEEIDGI